MRALAYEDNLLRLDTQYPEPRSGENEAVVRVLVAGICNTDMEITKGYMDFRGVLGHEFVGVVEESDWPDIIGKRVVGEINCACGTCRMCRADMSHHCPNRSVLGIAGHDGAFADKLVLPAVNLHVVPDSVKDEEAVFTEPLAAAFRIVEQVAVDPRTCAVVLGDGKLGLLVAQVLKLHTLEICLVGKHRAKLGLLDGTGIRTLLVEDVSQLDADLVIDCTGRPQGLQLALEIVRPLGTVVVKSTVADRIDADVTRMVVNEITLVGSRCGPFMPALRALEERVIDVNPLVSGQLPFDRAMEAFDLARQPETIKILLRISDR